MSQASDERMAELRELFFDSAHELLQALNDEALKLEKSPDAPAPGAPDRSHPEGGLGGLRIP